MGLRLLHAQLLVLILLILVSRSVSTQANSQRAKQNCMDRCGNVRIPFPFGTREGCYFNESFLVTCINTNSAFPKLFWRNFTFQITSISLKGQLRVLQSISKYCYSRTGTQPEPKSINLPFGFTVNDTANKFIVVGCDSYALVSGSRREKQDYITGCISLCKKEDLAELSCSGLGFCKISIPTQAWSVEVKTGSFENFTEMSDFNNCSYGFLAEESAFTFNASSLSTLRNVEKLPMVVDWAVGEETCKEAGNNISSYACKSENSNCYKPNNGYGYRCYCQEGYDGNPYLKNGCKDIDECNNQTLNICEKDCKNTAGGFKCLCPKGYHGDGKKDGRGCIRGQSLVLKVATGISIGITLTVVAIWWLCFVHQEKKLVKMKHTFFLQNGGLLLQEKLARGEQSPDGAKIFTSTELKKATNDFHDNRIVGQGGFGTVYKGFLSDNTIVAVKKSKQVDPNQVEQFINEVIVLSRINHRNVVKFLGCCLETQAPLLVYEFINNGTLFEHIHNKAKASSFSWDMRLRVAAEAAGVLAYLHSAASPPIIQRDVKSANILLDTNFTAKVSDFGASKLFPIDQTQLSTVVQGTFGYLDPEYMQTNQLTGKSDVYSFGVVLVELLTGKKALSYDRSEEERNLANYFLSTLKQNNLLQVLDDSIVCEGNSEKLTSVAMLAKRCLHVKGEDRPSMKEVAMELEGLRLAGKHSWNQTEPIEEESESLLSGKMNAFAIATGEGSSTSIGYDSTMDHISGR
ncbi:wall-associated receptor kinase 2-like isoform X1 [Olea europaea var. sylvestris]|uniref:wall-associated receptor kinase 2-like isoform X1 n=1 Tax=Olea europaea var. sylvestris TaxID=158386 RepID=UPI000C1D3CF6|nr:wall-associated receptor kinase 2-like isoform X1 [Olea europaea var. sylvestris]